MRSLPDPAPSRGWRRAAAAALPALALAGCAALPPPAPPPPAPPEGVPVVVATPSPVPAAPLRQAPDPAAATDAAARRLLAWQDRLRDLPPAELPREAQRLEQARQGPGDEAAAAALELALLLAQTRQAGELARALALAEGVARQLDRPAWPVLARLLQARLAELRRLEEQAERQAQQLRDQQRRLDQLASQLEALKAIERSLATRPPAQVPAPPAGRNPP